MKHHPTMRGDEKVVSPNAFGKRDSPRKSLTPVVHHPPTGVFATRQSVRHRPPPRR